jgi:hypothetical protein
MLVVLMGLLAPGALAHLGKGTQFITLCQLQAQLYFLSRGRHTAQPQQHEMHTPGGECDTLAGSDLYLIQSLHTLEAVDLPGSVYFHPFGQRRTGADNGGRRIGSIGDDQVAGRIGLPGRERTHPGVAHTQGRGPGRKDCLRRQAQNKTYAQ